MMLSQQHAAGALVGHMGDVVANPPQQRVGRGLTAGTGAVHVTDHDHVGVRFARSGELFDRTWVLGLVHRVGVQRAFVHERCRLRAALNHAEVVEDHNDASQRSGGLLGEVAFQFAGQERHIEATQHGAE